MSVDRFKFRMCVGGTEIKPPLTLTSCLLKEKLNSIYSISPLGKTSFPVCLFPLISLGFIHRLYVIKILLFVRQMLHTLRAFIVLNLRVKSFKLFGNE